MTQINVIDVVGKTALYKRYPMQSDPQPCYVELDCDSGELRCDYNAEMSGAIPFGVYHRRTLWWDIPPLRARAANALLETLREDAQIVLDGYDTDWDGDNMVGTYSDAATEAIERIRVSCEGEFCDGEHIIAVDAGDWFLSANSREEWAEEWGISSATTDEELEATASAILGEEYCNDVDVIDGMMAFLQECREAVDQADDEDVDPSEER